MLFTYTGFASSDGSNVIIIGVGGYEDINDVFFNSDSFENYDTVKFTADYRISSEEVVHLADKDVVVAEGASLSVLSGELSCKSIYVCGDKNYVLKIHPKAAIVDTTIYKTDSYEQIIIGYIEIKDDEICTSRDFNAKNLKFYSESGNNLNNVYAFDIGDDKLKLGSGIECKNGISDIFGSSESGGEESGEIKEPDGGESGGSGNEIAGPGSGETDEGGLPEDPGNSGDAELIHVIEVTYSNRQIYQEQDFYVNIKLSKCNKYSINASYDYSSARLMKAEFFGGFESNSIGEDVINGNSVVISKLITDFPDDGIVCRLHFKAINPTDNFQLIFGNNTVDNCQNPLIKNASGIKINVTENNGYIHGSSGSGGSGDYDNSKSTSSSTDKKDEGSSKDDDKSNEPNNDFEMGKSDTEGRFLDLDGYEWCADAVNSLMENGIIIGTHKNKFSPEQNIKRGDFMLMISRILKLSSGSSENFLDVPEDSYYFDSIAALKDLGIARGNKGLFMPEECITRQDLFCLIHRVLDHFNIIVPTDKNVSLEQFSDSDLVSSYALESIRSLVDNKIVNGNGDNLNPLGYATRAEIAVICSKIYDLFYDKN